MWISDEYYEELLRVINQCSQGSFDFDEQKLKDFDSAKYEKLTNALVGLKSHFKKHILKTIEALHAIIESNMHVKHVVHDRALESGAQSLEDG